MIRRDYILRMIENFSGRSRESNHSKADKNGERRTLRSIGNSTSDGNGCAAVAHLSETELLAHIVRGEPTLAVREKTLILATLLKEAG